MTRSSEQTFAQKSVLIIRLVLCLSLRLAVFRLLKPPLLIIRDAFQVEKEQEQKRCVQIVLIQSYFLSIRRRRPRARRGD
jgi:hypothetical protein